MKRSLPILALFAMIGVPASIAHGQEAGKKIENSFICVFKPGSQFTGGVSAAASSAARSVGGSVRFVYSAALRGFAATMSEAAAARLIQTNMNIDYCEQDQVVSLPSVQISAAQGGKTGTTTQPAQQVPWGIARVKGGESGSFGRAWIIDTGIDLKHPDLKVETAAGMNFYAVGTSPNDENGHGTHVAGTVAALNNSIGVIGVAPGASVVSVRVLDRRGSGSMSGVLAGVNHVAAKGAAGDVANMSLGGGPFKALDDAIIAAASKGIFFAIAAGNDTKDASNYSPARTNGTNVYTVSAFAGGDTFASFSNFGTPVDYSAPGVSIKSTWKGSSYNTISGTSMATPHLAGLLLHGALTSPVQAAKVIGDPDGVADPIAVYAPALVSPTNP